jgi:hypothetical protein
MLKQCYIDLVTSIIKKQKDQCNYLCNIYTIVFRFKPVKQSNHGIHDL